MASIIEFFSLGNLAIQSPCENLTILPKFVEKEICSRNLMYFIFDLFMDLVSWICLTRFVEVSSASWTAGRLWELGPTNIV